MEERYTNYEFGGFWIARRFDLARRFRARSTGGRDCGARDRVTNLVISRLSVSRFASQRGARAMTNTFPHAVAISGYSSMQMPLFAPCARARTRRCLMHLSRLGRGTRRETDPAASRRLSEVASARAYTRRRAKYEIYRRTRDSDLRYYRIRERSRGPPPPPRRLKCCSESNETTPRRYERVTNEARRRYRRNSRTHTHVRIRRRDNSRNARNYYTHLRAQGRTNGIAGISLTALNCARNYISRVITLLFNKFDYARLLSKRPSKPASRFPPPLAGITTGRDENAECR